MERKNSSERNNRIEENNSSKPMDSKRDVEQSNDEKTDQDFPGYPHYPAKEDIMDQRTDSHRVDVDVENLPNNRNRSGVSERFQQGGDKRQNAENAMSPQPGSGNDDLDIRMGNESDVNDDDLSVLNSTNDEIGTPQNVTNDDMNTDLDIPGSELDDKNEEIGEEDEENNYYSLGGDRHENQEEDPYSGPVRGES
ncbi:MAG TPA: hypothetical protein VFQ58_06845 [Flavisolibacter sp.]|jgi:hypothetical protein|nr:hypothetical protein [Flavisolibacter sp.]